MAESNTNPYLGITLVAGMLVVVAAMVAAVFIATQRPTVVVVQGDGATPPATAPAEQPPTPEPAPPDSVATDAPDDDRLRAVQVAQLPAMDDPFDAAWDDARSVSVDVMPQIQTAPTLDEQTIDRVDVQAMTDGRVIAFRLTWDIDEPAVQTRAGVFADAVAVQFPLVDHASFMMGMDGQPVHILYWKALWEHEREVGFQDVIDIYPHTWSDLYWFANGEFPYRVDEAFDEDGSMWLVAEQAGNPQSQRQRAEPVEEMIAEGFGTLTALPESHTAARGAWRDGRWSVVIARPLDIDDDALAQRLRRGGEQQVAVAVWDGGAGNVGARKHWSAWVDFTIESDDASLSAR